MNLDKFRQQLNSQGIARTNRWVTKVYPPSGLTTTGRALSNLLSTGGNRVNVNLPGLDQIDAGIDQLNNSRLNLEGISVESNFSIPTLGYTLSNMGGKLESLNLYCSGCQIPSRDVINSDFREYGETRSLGVVHQHSDLTFTYYCSEDLRERLFFEQWQDLIFDPQTKAHSYYKDYTSRVEVIKYDASWSRETAAYRFLEAYPTNIGAQEMSTGDQTLLELNITFKFRNYERIL